MIHLNLQKDQLKIFGIVQRRNVVVILRNQNSQVDQEIFIQSKGPQETDRNAIQLEARVTDIKRVENIMG